MKDQILGIKKSWLSLIFLFLAIFLVMYLAVYSRIFNLEKRAGTTNIAFPETFAGGSLPTLGGNWTVSRSSDNKGTVGLTYAPCLDEVCTTNLRKAVFVQGHATNSTNSQSNTSVCKTVSGLASGPRYQLETSLLISSLPAAAGTPEVYLKVTYVDTLSVSRVAKVVSGSSLGINPNRRNSWQNLSQFFTLPVARQIIKNEICLTAWQNSSFIVEKVQLNKVRTTASNLMPKENLMSLVDWKSVKDYLPKIKETKAVTSTCSITGGMSYCSNSMLSVGSCYFSSNRLVSPEEGVCWDDSYNCHRLVSDYFKPSRCVDPSNKSADEAAACPGANVYFCQGEYYMGFECDESCSPRERDIIECALGACADPAPIIPTPTPTPIIVDPLMTLDFLNGNLSVLPAGWTVYQSNKTSTTRGGAGIAMLESNLVKDTVSSPAVEVNSLTFDNSSTSSYFTKVCTDLTLASGVQYTVKADVLIPSSSVSGTAYLELTSGGTTLMTVMPNQNLKNLWQTGLSNYKVTPAGTTAYQLCLVAANGAQAVFDNVSLSALSSAVTASAPTITPTPTTPILPMSCPLGGTRNCTSLGCKCQHTICKGGVCVWVDGDAKNGCVIGNSCGSYY